MKNVAIIVSLVAGLVIGGGAGFVSGKGANNNTANDKKLADSISMMKEQSIKIQKMGEMMKEGGTAMQELGMKLNDNDVVMKGKDLETVAAKYMDENKKSENKDSMKPIMGS